MSVDFIRRKYSTIYMIFTPERRLNVTSTNGELKLVRVVSLTRPCEKCDPRLHLHLTCETFSDIFTDFFVFNESYLSDFYF